MTDAELDALDRRVAEKVMGYPANYGGPLNCLNYQPTRDIAQAWQCLEKFQYQALGHHDKDQVWTVWMYHGELRVEAQAETASLAICMAALKAKGVEV